MTTRCIVAVSELVGEVTPKYLWISSRGLHEEISLLKLTPPTYGRRVVSPGIADTHFGPALVFIEGRTNVAPQIFDRNPIIAGFRVSRVSFHPTKRSHVTLSKTRLSGPDGTRSLHFGFNVESLVPLARTAEVYGAQLPDLLRRPSVRVFFEIHPWRIVIPFRQGLVCMHPLGVIGQSREINPLY